MNQIFNSTSDIEQNNQEPLLRVRNNDNTNTRRSVIAAAISSTKCRCLCTNTTIVIVLSSILKFIYTICLMVPCAPSSILDFIPSRGSSSNTNSTMIMSSEYDIQELMTNNDEYSNNNASFDNIQSRNALIVGSVFYLIANLIEWITCKNGLIGSLLSTIGASLFISAFVTVTSVTSVTTDTLTTSAQNNGYFKGVENGGVNWEFFIGGIFLFVKYTIDLIFNCKAKRFVSVTSYVLALLSSFLFVILGMVGFAAHGNGGGGDDTDNSKEVHYFRTFCNLVFSSAFFYCLSAIMYGIGQFVDTPVESWIDGGM